MEHFVAIVPKSMQFAAAQGSQFSPMPDDSGATVQVATTVKPGTSLAFSVSGTGLLPEENEQSASAGGGAGGGGNRPGGGLGPPVEGKSPLEGRATWYVLGGLLAAMVIGAVYAFTRPATAAASTNGAGRGAAPAGSRGAASAAAPLIAASATPAARVNILDALKEELFQLEVDRQQGRISPEEYEQAKSALDQTIRRAVTRAQAAKKN
jgi:hypothetical protein